MTDPKEATKYVAPALPGFRVRWRNAGHWDFLGDMGRLFRLRGGPGKWRVSDCRPGRNANWIMFRDQGAAIAWIMAELMWEPLAVEGQPQHVMEAWNVWN